MPENLNDPSLGDYALSYLYKGRHRLADDHDSNTNKPTVSKAAIAGTIAIGAMVGVGTATPAYAAPDEVWDQLAECESSGNWSINTGNGYSGGLQFAPTTWRGFKPSGYPDLAHQASREQQIVVAERVLDAQGWGAWPACSARLGIRDEGVDLRTAPSNSAPQTTTQTTTTTPAPYVPPASTTPTTTTQTPEPPPQTTPQTTPQSDRVITGDTYTVVSGDTLSQIAFDLDKDILWPELFDKNRGVVEDPDLIYPGEVLDIS